MKHLLVVAVVLAVVFGFDILPGLAQGGDQCGAIREWEEFEVGPLLHDFDDIDEDARGLETIVELQSLRRDFDDEEVPPEAAEVKALLVRMIDLRIDALIAFEIEDEDLGEDLLDDSEDAREDALELLSTSCATTASGELAEITSPAAEEEVPHEAIVEGTYDPDALGENQLWVVLYAQDNKFYPQVIMNPDCDDEDASSVTYGPQPGAWIITSFVGGEGDEQSGFQYDIILYAADPAEHDAMLRSMAGWCRDQSWPGFSTQEFTGYGFEFVDSVRGIRE